MSGEQYTPGAEYGYGYLVPTLRRPTCPSNSYRKCEQCPGNAATLVLDAPFSHITADACEGFTGDFNLNYFEFPSQEVFVGGSGCVDPVVVELYGPCATAVVPAVSLGIDMTFTRDCHWVESFPASGFRFRVSHGSVIIQALLFGPTTLPNAVPPLPCTIWFTTPSGETTVYLLDSTRLGTASIGASGVENLLGPYNLLTLPGAGFTVPASPRDYTFEFRRIDGTVIGSSRFTLVGFHGNWFQ